jgi:DNA-binding transcriptional LysR family regulator
MNELESVVDAAEAGLGLTVSSAENVLSALRERRLVRVLESYTIAGGAKRQNQVIMQYARSQNMPVKVRVLVDFLLEELKDRNPLDVVARSIAVRA